MVSNLKYSGARLVSYEFGLVSDFPLSLPYSVPYYLKLVFSKARPHPSLESRVMTDIWAVKSQSFECFSYLDKIVDRKEGDFTKCTYYFTDGTLIDIA